MNAFLQSDTDPRDCQVFSEFFFSYIDFTVTQYCYFLSNYSILMLRTKVTRLRTFLTPVFLHSSNRYFCLLFKG